MANVAPWAHDKDGNSTDPINLVFEGATAEEVAQDMQNQLHGWSPPRLRDDLYLHIGNRQEAQDEQLARGMFSMANAFRRISRLRPPHPLSYYRVHVRLWNMNKADFLWRLSLAPEHYDVLGSAHTEPSLWFHNPESFEWAEKLVARQLKRINYEVAFDDVPLGNASQAPPNNGFATRLWR